MIRVVLADDQLLVRAGFQALLDAQDDIVVVGEAGDGEEALAVTRRTQPDVVLMDIRMPGVDGLEATRSIGADPSLDAVRVVILTTFELDEYVFEALRSGASGFLVKDTEPVDAAGGTRGRGRRRAALAQRHPPSHRGVRGRAHRADPHGRPRSPHEPRTRGDGA